MIVQGIKDIVIEERKRHEVGIKEVRLVCGHYNGSAYSPDHIDRG